MTPAGPKVAYRWQNGVVSTVPAVPGGSGSTAWAVNAGGNAVGEMTVGSRGRAFIWTAQGGVAVLPALDNDQTRTETALAINASNVVVGVACCPSVAVRWTYANGAWSASNIGTLGGSFDKATGIVRVAESGIRTHADVLRLRRAGFHGFLVGESLLRQNDRARAVLALRKGES
jgi:uncharacterized membrane protein